MIIYSPNKNWFSDMRHLFTSWTMTKIMRTVLAIGLYTLIIWIVEVAVFNGKVFQFSASIFSLLGIVLSILLVFRTNTAYERWWEGRQQWGALVNHCRNLAITAEATFPREDHAEKHRLAVLISNFCIALKEHLREGTKIEELLLLNENDKVKYPQKEHIPAYISSQIHALIQHQYKEKRITGEDVLNFKPQMQALMDIAGACERIKKTPIPFSYSVYLKIFISIYGLLLPFALTSEIGIWAVPAVMFVFFAFIGVELMAEEIEDPFGLDCNDLPTGTIAETISRNVFELLDHTHPKERKPEENYSKIF
jgi:ion channel-forming bestrophin family protein